MAPGRSGTRSSCLRRLLQHVWHQAGPLGPGTVRLAGRARAQPALATQALRARRGSVRGRWPSQAWGLPRGRAGRQAEMDLHMGGRAEPALPGTERPAVAVPVVAPNAMPPATRVPNASQERQLPPRRLRRRIPPRLNEPGSTQTPVEGKRAQALCDAGRNSHPKTRRTNERPWPSRVRMERVSKPSPEACRGRGCTTTRTQGHGPGCDAARDWPAAQHLKLGEEGLAGAGGPAGAGRDASASPRAVCSRARPGGRERENRRFPFGSSLSVYVKKPHRT